MAKAKSKPDPDLMVRELARLLKSVADENRLKILFMLAEHGEMHVGAIGEELDQSQPAVSHHLAQLKSAGLVDVRREGKFNYYASNPTGVSQVFAEMFPSGPAKVNLGGVEISLKKK